MRVIVFGGKGFLGSHVVDELKARGHEVTTYDLKDNQDILHPTSVEEAVEGQDIVYNFAGQPDIDASINFPGRTCQLNILGNLNILSAAKEAGAKRYVFASTVYVFSKKGSFYGISKQAAERCVEEFGVPYTILRYGTVYGPKSGPTNRIYRMLHQALTEGKIYFEGTGDEEREFIHAKDAARLSVDILNDRYANEHIMLTGNERHSYSSMLEMIYEIMKASGVKTYVREEEADKNYKLTPYSYQPPQSLKLMANPYIDLGQGLLETIEDISARLRKES